MVDTLVALLLGSHVGVRHILSHLTKLVVIKTEDKLTKLTWLVVINVLTKLVVIKTEDKLTKLIVIKRPS